MKTLCFNIDEDFIKYGICDEQYKLLETHKLPTEKFTGKATIINQICKIINSYEQIKQVAISITGRVNSETGVVTLSSVFKDYYEVKLKEEIEKKTNTTVFVENNVCSTAIAEAYFGNAKEENSFICISYSSKIKAAIFINGTLYKGADYSSGEIGYMITHKDENIKYNDVASTKALLTAVNNASDEKFDSVFNLNLTENEKVIEAINNWVDEAFAGILNIICSFNPPLIILCGEIMNNKYVDKQLSKRLSSCFEYNLKNTKIINSCHSNDMALIGVSYLADHQ